MSAVTVQYKTQIRQEIILAIKRASDKIGGKTAISAKKKVSVKANKSVHTTGLFEIALIFTN
jgi:hypothetical protein